jgi:hypothetical protein
LVVFHNAIAPSQCHSLARFLKPSVHLAILAGHSGREHRHVDAGVESNEKPGDQKQVQLGNDAADACGCDLSHGVRVAHKGVTLPWCTSLPRKDE